MGKKVVITRLREITTTHAPPVTTTICIVVVFASGRNQIGNSLMEVRASSCCARLQWERLGQVSESRQRLRGVFDKFDTLCSLPNFFTPLRLTGLTAAMVRGKPLSWFVNGLLERRGSCYTFAVMLISKDHERRHGFNHAKYRAVPRKKKGGTLSSVTRYSSELFRVTRTLAATIVSSAALPYRQSCARGMTAASTLLSSIRRRVKTPGRPI